MGHSSSHHPLEYSPVVHTKSGPVRGKTFNFHEKKIDGYMGIPYAEPPVGKLRFQVGFPIRNQKVNITETSTGAAVDRDKGLLEFWTQMPTI